MIAIVKPGTPKEGVAQLCEIIKARKIINIGSMKARIRPSSVWLVIRLALTPYLLESNSMVEAVRRVQPFKKANRKFHPDDTVIEVGGVKIGGKGNFVVMAGPCSVESEEQCMIIAEQVKKHGAAIFRGGAFKPRTGASFQGWGKEGLDILSKVKREFDMPIITEIMDARDLDLFDDVDILQVGARNMQNFSLLKELGRYGKPVLLKRGMSATIDELVLVAEYIMSEGNDQVMLCERGIRTFETRTRDTFDVSAIPVLRELTHLPIIADPSHATGCTRYRVRPCACAATAAQADGLEVEAHHDPAHAASDGAQALLPEQFEDMMRRVGIDSLCCYCGMVGRDV